MIKQPIGHRQGRFLRRGVERGGPLAVVELILLAQVHADVVQFLRTDRPVVHHHLGDFAGKETEVIQPPAERRVVAAADRKRVVVRFDFGSHVRQIDAVEVELNAELGADTPHGGGGQVKLVVCHAEVHGAGAVADFRTDTVFAGFTIHGQAQAVLPVRRADGARPDHRTVKRTLRGLLSPAENDQRCQFVLRGERRAEHVSARAGGLAVEA